MFNWNSIFTPYSYIIYPRSLFYSFKPKMVTFYDLSAKRPNGHIFNFEELKDKVILIVNTGVQCVFTPQRECMIR